MFKIENKKIHITRGDIALIEIKVQNDDGSDYIFQKDDVIQLNVFKSKDCSCVVLTKRVTVEDQTTSVNISLTSKDTTIGELINKPVKYWYEVILNPDNEEQTIIAYDEEGAKEFWLYPEAKEVDN